MSSDTIFRVPLTKENSSQHITYSMKQSPSWESNMFSANQEIPRIFMELEGSLPHSQVPANYPYSGPARSSPYPHILLPEDPTSYYPPIYAWVSQAVSFLRVSPPAPCINLSSPPIRATCPAHLILRNTSSDYNHLTGRSLSDRSFLNTGTPDAQILLFFLMYVLV